MQNEINTEKTLILSTKPFAVEVRWKSWLLTLTALFLLMVVYFGTYLNFHPLLRVLCSVMTGLLLVRLFVIYHDHQHHAILYKSVGGNILFTLFGLFILTPTSIWKRSHDFHHNHNSKLFSANIGSYPIMTKREYLSASKKERFWYLFSRNPITISCGYVFMFMYGMCVRSFIANPSKHYDSIIALVLHFISGFCIFWFLGWQTFLFAWIIPFTITCSIGAYLFYAQHNFPGTTFKEKTEWSYVNAAMESSSFLKMNLFWRWVSANIGYHHIHHLNPRIPFYRLPETMKKIPELQKTKITTLNPIDIYRCLRLKVWDPEENRMLTLRELKSCA